MKNKTLKEIMKEQDTSISISTDDNDDGFIITGYPNPISFLLCEEILRRAFAYDELMKEGRYSKSEIC